jgi:CheY-like chemotaxis protein/signal transduction histidine kinase
LSEEEARSIVVVSGRVDGPIKGVDFSLACNEGLFHLRVFDAEQMRFCQSLQPGDRVVAVGSLHSRIHRRCGGHHAWIRALAIAPAGDGLAAELRELAGDWFADETALIERVRAANSEALRALDDYEAGCRTAWEAAAAYPYTLQAGTGTSLTAGEWARSALSPLKGDWSEATEPEWRELIHPEDVEKVSRHVQALASGQPSAVEFRLAREDERWLHDQARPDGEGERIYGVLQDVSDRKWLEAQVLELHQMPIVRRLAGGVVHGLNNALTLIMARVELIAYRLGPEHQALLDDDVAEIGRAVEQAAWLVQRLQAFSQRTLVLPELLDLNAVVADMGDMLGRVVKENIALVVAGTAAPGTVRADHGQVQQILINLVVHLCDRMREGGRLEIETSEVLLDGSQARGLDLAPGAYVAVAVSGQGPGVDGAQLCRSEPGDEDSGVGLSVAYQVARLSGIPVRAESQAQGATFRVYLPQVSGADVVAAVKQAQSEPPAMETVLVVEDEERVRSLVSYILAINGFAVLESRSGEEALEACARHPGPVHLVVSDVMLPGMSGPELVEQLMGRYPGLKAIFISGYADAPLTPPQGMPFLRKPFGGGELVREVYRAMAGERE